MVSIKRSLINSCRIRGFLGIMGPLIVAFGILFAYICGAFVEYRLVPYCILGFPVMFFIVMLYTPETPHTLLRRTNLQESLIIFFKFKIKGKLRVKK